MNGDQGELAYFDTSALAKLVVSEPETEALQDFIASVPRPARVTSGLTRTELLRVGLKHGSAALRQAKLIMRGINCITLTEALHDEAGVLPPPSLRSLDAIHVATALELGNDLGYFVAYDHRLLSAAADLGFSTIAPA